MASHFFLLFSDTKDRNSPCFAVGSYYPQCRPDIYLRGGAEAGYLVIANAAAAAKHSCSTYSNRHTTVRTKALGIARCSQAVLSRQCCQFREFLIPICMNRVTLSDLAASKASRL